MIHSMLLPTHSETSTTSSSSHLYPWPEPGTLQLPTQQQQQQQEHDHEEKHSAKQVGQSDSFPTNLLKPITPQTELDYCSSAKAQGTMIKLEPTAIFLNPSKACVDCNTTKTPLWRSGPQGPKSLCNACGIRHRKARRALAVIAAGDDPSKLQPNLKRTKLQQHLDPTLTSKKRSKIQQKGSHSHQLCFRMENLHVGCSDHHGKEGLYYARRVFPKDEEEAAVLLMALSCGLVHG